MPSLPLPELIEWAELVADEVRAGEHDVHADPDERWHVRLFQDAFVDVWLISWTSDQGTQMHDHGGSSGAYTVVGGSLTEVVWDPTVGRAVERDVSAGDSVVFGEEYVHDVRNIRAETAVSVHVYSPPLAHMNFYDVDDDGQLTRLAQVWTDDPEVAMPELGAVG